MGFCFKYIKRIVSSVLLAGVVSSPVMGAANGGAAGLGDLNSKEKNTDFSGVQQGLDDSANFENKDSNQTFLSNNKRDASGIPAKDNPKAKKDTSDTAVKAYKQTSKNLVYAANGPSTKAGELNGKQIINEPGFLKSAVDAVKSSDPKVVSAAFLTLATAGGAVALAKNYSSNKDSNTTPIPDPFDPDQNSNNGNSNEKDDPNTLQNKLVKKEISKAVYLWITLGVALLAVLVVLFLYRTRILIKILGYDKCVKIFHWSDLDKKFYYRKIFGYKKYIEDFPADWWKLYTDKSYVKNLEKQFSNCNQEAYQESQYVFETNRKLQSESSLEHGDVNTDCNDSLRELFDICAKYVGAWIKRLEEKEVQISMNNENDFFLNCAGDKVSFGFFHAILCCLNLYPAFEQSTFPTDFSSNNHKSYQILFYLYNVEAALKWQLVIPDTRR